MNRREFLKSLAAIGWSTTLPGISLTEAPNAVIDQVWTEAISNPMVFYVKPWGTISFGNDDDYPCSRLSLFDLTPVASRQDLFDLQDELCTFEWFLENEWLERSEAEDDDDDDYGYKATSFDDWQSWLKAVPDDVVREVVDHTNAWLEEFPGETDWEIANRRGYTDQGSALTFFRDDFEFNDLFNIVIVEGDHPGSSYYAAELHMDVDEANQLALEEGIPVRFEWDSD